MKKKKIHQKYMYRKINNNNKKNTPSVVGKYAAKYQGSGNRIG